MAKIKSTKVRYGKLLVIVAFIGFAFTTQVQAQHSTSSPYSMFGIGEIENRTYGMNSGMAGAGIGLQIPNFLNNSNPASLRSIDSLTFIFDVATAAKLSYFTYGKAKDNDVNMSPKKLAIGFRITPKWGASLGIRPYSGLGYKVNAESSIEGSIDTYTTHFEGSGGLTRLYWSNSYRLTNNLSLGANVSFLFGTIDQTEQQQQFKILKSSYAQKFYFDFGAQYTNKLEEDMRYTLGAVYGYKTGISLSNKKTVSLVSSGQVLEDDTEASTKTYMPQYFGAGASLTSSKNSRKWIFAADYLFEGWGAIAAPAHSVKYVDSHKISVGAQYTPNTRLPKNYFQRMDYQLGASYNLSYLQINGEQLKEYGVTLGFNFPLQRSTIYFSTEFGYRGATGQVKEKYILFTGGVSLAETWFFKRFYE